MGLYIEWDEHVYNSVVQSLCLHIGPGGLDPSVFCIPQSPAEIPGNLLLGRLLDAPTFPFCWSTDWLRTGVQFTGVVGSGKTEAAKLLCDRILQEGSVGLLVSDPKSDEFVTLGLKHRDLTILRADELRFNLFHAPPGVPLHYWDQLVVAMLSQLFNFWEGAQAYLLRIVERLRQNGECVTTRRILSYSQETRKILGFKDVQAKPTVESRLYLIHSEAGEMVSTESELLEKIHETRCLLLLKGLSQVMESLVCEFILLFFFTWRQFSPSACRPLFCLFDESQHSLFSNEKERQPKKLGAATISSLVDRCRALGIGLGSVSQEPSTIIKAAMNNAGLRVAFRQGSGAEISAVTSALGLNKEQSEYMFQLEPGQAIVRSAYGFKEPYVVQFDRFLEPEQPDWREFWLHQAMLRSELYQHAGIDVDSKPSSSRVGSLKTDTSTYRPSQHLANKCPSTSPSAGPLQPSLPNASNDQPSDELKSLIRGWLNRKDPWLLQGELLATLGIKSGSKQTSLKRHAVTHGLIVVHRLQKKKTWVHLWEPTERALQLAGIENKPRLRSKGGFLHAVICMRLACRLKEAGFQVTIEGLLANKKSVDVLARDNEKLIAYEIAVSPPLHKEINNLIKDLSADPKPDRVVLLTLDAKARDTLQAFVAQEPYLLQELERIETKLAGEFL